MEPNDGVVIREDIPAYMRQLKAWLAGEGDVRLEEMSDFFAARLDRYEEHMRLWAEAYPLLADMLPPGVESVLDLGCGTGLELDALLAARPGLSVTGVDLTEAMLAQLRRKHPGVRAICADYFTYPFAPEAFDAVLSFETLHHFKPDKKRGLFRRLFDTLKPGGTYLEVDYLACCDEEERLLMEACEQKRRAEGLGEDVFVHFDTPLTAAHELSLLRDAGFADAALVRCVNGAAFLLATKPRA